MTARRPIVLFDRATDGTPPADLVVLRPLLQHHGRVTVAVTDRGDEVADNRRRWSPTTAQPPKPGEREEALV